MGIKWTTRKVTVPAGEYKTEEVTQHVTADGRFTITPVGGMRYCRSHGVHGDMYNRWVWSGYRLQADGQPIGRYSRVTTAKRIAERKAK